MANTGNPLDEFTVAEPVKKQVTANPLDEFVKTANPLDEFEEKPEEDKTGQPILDTEIAEIAKKHKLPPEAYLDYLRDVVQFRGGYTETPVDAKKAAYSAGAFVGEAFMFGLPQFLQKKMEKDPRIRAAIDDLGDLVDERKTWTRTGLEMAGGLLTGATELKLAKAGVQAGAKVLGKELGKEAAQKAITKEAAETGVETLGKEAVERLSKEAAEKAATKIASPASGVAIGAGAGLAGTREGEELKGAAIGAGLGLGLVGLAEYAIPKTVKYINNKRIQKAAAEADQAWLENPDSTALITQEVAKTKTAQRVVDSVIDRAIAAADEKEIKNLSAQLNDNKKLAQLFGQGNTPEEIAASGQKVISDAADEIFASLDKEGQRRLLSELKDMKLLDKNNVVTAFGKARIVQQYLDQNLPKVVEKYGVRSESIGSSLDYLRTRAGEGADFLKKEFQNIMQKNALDKLISEDIIRKAKVGEGEGMVLRNLAQSLVDAQFVLRGMDRRLGTRLEPILNKMNFQYNAFTRTLGQVIKDREYVTEQGEKVVVRGLESLEKMRASINLSQEDLYKFLDKGITDIPDPKKAEVVTEYRKWFAESRKLANEQGLNIADFTQKYGGYVPHMVMDRIEVAKRLRDTVATLRDRYKINLLDYKTADYEKAAAAGLREDANYRSLKDSLEYLNGRPITTPEDMNQILAKQVNPRTAGMRDVSSAAATFRREVEEVPALIREVDVNKLATRWASTTLKHAFLRDGFSQVENVRDMLAKRGFYKDSEYLSNWLTDNLGGVRSNTWRAAAQDFSNTLLNIRDNAKADSQLRRISEWMLDGGANTAMRFFGSVYPNFLGFNARSALQNLSQPILVTAPELGPKGMEYAMRALKNCALDPKEAMRLGGLFRAAQWNTELSAVLEASMKRSWIGKTSDRVIDTYAKTAMAMYEAAERANRIIVVQMGKELVKDVLAGDAVARNYIKKLNPGMRNAVKEALAANDQKLVEELLVNNLLDKTIFQYNKLSMSNFGRVAGPVLSTFSKWPTVIAGDVIDAYARQGVGQGSKELFGRYMLPLATLAVLNAGISQEGTPFKQQDVQMQALLGGEQGLTSMSPLMSLRQGIGVPPAVVSAGQFTKAILVGDTGKAGSALASVGDAYIPMIPGVLRTMNDVTKLTTGGENEVRSLETLFEAVTE